MSVFPPELPKSLDDPDVIREHDWQTFRRLTCTENHWDRPGWRPGRRSYHWMLSFADAHKVRQLAKQCQAQLPQSVLDLVPLDAIHMTLGRIGFTDELAKTRALALANEVASYCRKLTPFALTVGPLAGSKGAMRFSVAPWSPLLTLHRQFASATRAMLGEQCVMDTSQFRPHLSIAYVNTAVPIASLLPALERLRTFATVDVTISSVALVELRRDRRAYRYEEIARLVLRGDDASIK